MKTTGGASCSGIWMMRVPNADPDQLAALKERLYAALAEIEV